VAAQVADQIAHFSSDVGVSMCNELLQVVVDICVVNGLVKVLVNPRQLADQGQSINDQFGAVVTLHQLVLANCGKTTALNKLVSEVLGTLSGENKLADERKGDWHVIVGQVTQGVEGQVDNISFGHL
jgi:hypothetical protein